MGFPGGSVVKNLPAMQETWVLIQVDPLEKEMANHSSILVWEIPWTEEPGGHSPKGGKQLDTTEGLSTHREKIGAGRKEHHVLPTAHHFHKD